MHQPAEPDTTRDDQRDPGAVTAEYLAWGALSVVAIAVIATGLQAVGLDVVEHIRSTLGV